MTDDASVAAAVATVGSLDVLVNNAGVAGTYKPAPAVAYSSHGTRSRLRARGIVTVIPEPADQAGHH